MRILTGSRPQALRLIRTHALHLGHRISPFGSSSADASMDRKARPPRFAAYVAGNASALLCGLIAAYFALAVRGLADPSVLNLRTVDLSEYVTAASLILHGHAGAVYDLTALGHAQAGLVGAHTSSFGVLAYLYPPFFLIPFIPLSAMPYTAAYIIWLAANCVLLAISMYFLERHAGLSRRGALLFRMAAIVFLPVFMALGLGQASIYLLACFTGCFFAARSDRWWLAGSLLALATLKPFYVAPVLLVFLVRREWRALAGYVTTLAGLCALVLPFGGIGMYVSYVDILRLVTTWQSRTIDHPLWYHHMAIAPGTYAAEWNQSIAGFVDLLISPPMATVITLVACAFVLALVFWKARADGPIDVALASAIPAGLLISPHTLAYDLSLLLIPVAVSLRLRGRFLVPLLVIGYGAITIGYKLAFFVPIQLSPLAMAAVLIWLASSNGSRYTTPGRRNYLAPAPLP